MAYNTGKRTRILSEDMKNLVVLRYNNKSLDEHFPKVKTEKIRIVCVDCNIEYDSNNYDFLDKYPSNRCVSCVQVVVWEQNHIRLSAIRQTDGYRSKMSKSVKSSEAHKRTRKEQGEKHTLYWDNVRGFTKEELWSEWELYKKTVYNMTEKVYRHDSDDINPDKLPRMDYNLDHKYSILEGFKNNIPPYIMSDICNLEIIPRYDNLSKGCDCSITKDKLFNMFFKREDADVADTCYGN